MTSFDDPGPPHIVFGAGAEARLPALLAAHGAQRVLLVCTARHRAGAERLHAALGSRSVGLWDGARPQVPRACADDLIARARALDADWLLAHGGGTAVGAAKAAALALPVRIAAVPTTYAGSEMTPIWGISQDGVKTTGRDARVQPALVVYDPSLLTGLRTDIARTSLVNALAHAVDAIFSCAPRAAAARQADDPHAEITEQAARAIEHILRALGDPARDTADALYGAHLAGLVLGRAPMALHHKLAHVLGGSFHTPHAATHTNLLPWTLAANLPHAPEAAAVLRRAFQHADPSAALFDRLRALDLPTRLSGLGFAESDIPRAVGLALKKQYPNPAPVDAPLLTRLLADATLGRRPGSLQRPLGPHDAPAAWLEGDGVGVLAVHGRGATAERMIRMLRADLPADACVCAPQAHGNSWYPRGYREIEANAAGRAAAFATLDAAWAQLAARGKRVVLVGFSQGACLALSWWARRPADARPREVIAWSGATHPELDRIQAAHGTAFYLGGAHGDRWVPGAHIEQTAAALRSAGARVQLALAASDRHEIRPSDHAALQRALES